MPARGGVGEVVEYQANVIASVLAERWHGSYKMLHLPDGLSKDSLDMLVTLEPQIKEISELIHRTDILVFWYWSSTPYGRCATYTGGCAPSTC